MAQENVQERGSGRVAAAVVGARWAILALWIAALVFALTQLPARRPR